MIYKLYLLYPTTYPSQSVKIEQSWGGPSMVFLAYKAKNQGSIKVFSRSFSMPCVSTQKVINYIKR